MYSLERMVTWIAIQLLSTVYLVSSSPLQRCSPVILVEDQRFEEAHTVFDFSTSPSLPNALSSGGIQMITLTLWHKQQVINGNQQILRVTMDDSGDEVSYNSKRIGFYVKDNKYTMRSLTSNALTAIELHRATDLAEHKTWHFAVLSFDPANNKVLYWSYRIFRLTHLAESTNAGFDQALDWSFDSSLKLYVGGDPHLGNFGIIRTANLICYPNYYSSGSDYSLMFGAEAAPKVYMNFDLRSTNLITDQVLGYTYDMSDENTDPVWDHATNSLDFSGASDKHISITPDSSIETARPLVLWSIYFEMSYQSSLPPAGCELHRIFSRRASDGSYLYEFGVSDNDFKFRYMSSTGKIGSDLIGYDASFSRVFASCYLLGFDPGIFCEIIVNDVVVYSGINTIDFDVPSYIYSESNTDYWQIGGTSCSAPIKLRYFGIFQGGAYITPACTPNCDVAIGIDELCLKPSCGSYNGQMGSLSCITCDASCQTCIGTGSNECLTCAPTYYALTDTELSCVTTCPLDKYADSSTMSCIDCDSTCLTCSGSTATDCDSCSGSGILDDGSCGPNCSSGKYSMSRVCVITCPSHYYNHTDTCLECPSECSECELDTSNPSDIAQVKCTECVLPNILEDSLCKPTTSCEDGEYLSDDNQCITCDPDCLQCEEEPTKCITCPPGLLLLKDSCTNVCPPGLTKEESSCINEFALIGIDQETAQVAGAATQATTAVVASASIASNVSSGGGSSTFFQFMLLLALLSYFRFFNVNYPGNVTLLFEYLNAPTMQFPNFFKLLIHPDEEAILQPAKKASNYKYSEYKVTTLFLEGYGPNISMILALFTVWFMVYALAILFSKSKNKYKQKTSALFYSIRDLIQWNMFITFILAYLIRLVNSVVLQLRYPTFGSVYEIVSFSLAILFFLLLVAAVTFLAIAKDKPALNSWNYIMTKCNVLVSDLKSEDSKQKPTPLYLLLRNISLVIAVHYLSPIPIAQACITLIICIAYTVVLFRRRVFKSVIQSRVMKCSECLLLLNLIVVLLFAVDDHVQVFSNRLRFNFGWLFIGVKLTLLLLLFVYQISETMKVVKALVSKYLCRPLKPMSMYGKLSSRLEDCCRRCSRKTSTISERLEVIFQNKHLISEGSPTPILSERSQSISICASTSKKDTLTLARNEDLIITPRPSIRMPKDLVLGDLSGIFEATSVDTQMSRPISRSPSSNPEELQSSDMQLNDILPPKSPHQILKRERLRSKPSRFVPRAQDSY